MRYFIIAGERSGDLHAATLIKEIKKIDFDAEIMGFGGDMMQAQGMTLLKHYRHYSYMGLVEVVTNIPKIWKTMRACKKALITAKPDVLILVDYPGFNLKMAAFAKKNNIKNCFYIAPKIWAWNTKRIKSIKKNVDKMMVILPFEVDFFRKEGYEVEYVGNPLLDSIKNYSYQEIKPYDCPTVALLPGSRKQEVKKSLPVFLEIVKEKKNYQFLIASVSNLSEHYYEVFKSYKNVKILKDRAYDLLKVANMSVVVSGTATLEACLLNSPQIVVYKTNRFTYFIGKLLIKVPYLSLVNLIAGSPVVREFIQDEFNAKSIIKEMDRILFDSPYCAKMLDEYRKIKEKIGYNSVSKQAAHSLVKGLQKASS